ncbi:hypothetical protein M413DRAFT_449330, partial [Hebeloma cylindrosporum]
MASSPELLRPPVFRYEEEFNAEVVQDGSDLVARATCSPSVTQVATAKAFSTNRIIFLVLSHLSRCLFENKTNKKSEETMSPSRTQCLLWACLTTNTPGVTKFRTTKNSFPHV